MQILFPKSSLMENGPSKYYQGYPKEVLGWVDNTYRYSEYIYRLAYHLGTGKPHTNIDFESF